MNSPTVSLLVKSEFGLASFETSPCPNLVKYHVFTESESEPHLPEYVVSRQKKTEHVTIRPSTGGVFTSGPDEQLIRLSKVVDGINQRHGCDRVRLAGVGCDPSLHHKRQ